MRNRRKRILILLLLTPLFFLLLLPFIERFRGHIALARYKRHLAARGFKLTAAEFRLPPPERRKWCSRILSGRAATPVRHRAFDKSAASNATHTVWPGNRRFSRG